MKISVVISSMNREEDILLLLGSIAIQSMIPDEVCIVEAGQLNEKVKNTLLTQGLYQGIYEHFPKSSLTQANNRGIEKTTGEIVFFLDDDIVLENDFIAEILKVFKEKGEDIGGVIGTITNVDRTSKVERPINLVYKLFLLNRYSNNGKFTRAGFGTYVHGLTAVTATEFLSGGITAYRREALRAVGGWDNTIPRYGACCDEDMSYRVSRRYKNFYTPYARCIHKTSPASRQSYSTGKAMMLRHRAYLFNKNFRRTPFSWLYFIWAVVGLYIIALYSRDRAELKGYLQGTWSILRKKVP